MVDYPGTESKAVVHVDVPVGQRINATLTSDAHSLLHQKITLALNPRDLQIFDIVSGLALQP